MAPSAPVKLSKAELATVREAMHERPRLLGELDAGTIEIREACRRPARAIAAFPPAHSAASSGGAPA